MCNVWRAVGGCLEWFEWFWVVAGSAGWLSGLRFCGFGVGVVGLVGSPCDGFCMVVCGDCCVGVMFENSTVCHESMPNYFCCIPFASMACLRFGVSVVVGVFG